MRCYILVFGQLLVLTGGALVSKMWWWYNPIACVKRACAKSEAQNQSAICPTDTLCSDEITATRRFLRTKRPRNYTRVRTAFYHFMAVLCSTHTRVQFRSIWGRYTRSLTCRASWSLAFVARKIRFVRPRSNRLAVESIFFSLGYLN